jgi:hypothetical protein
MTQRVLIYRLPNASFPVRFEMLGEIWELQVRPVEHGTFWAAQLVGPSRWHAAHGASQQLLEAALRNDGVSIGSRTFVGTAFRRLADLGFAERLQSPTSC